jgi:hypothetical protein
MGIVAQPPEGIPVILRGLPKAQPGKVPALSEGSVVPEAYCVAGGSNHRPRETEGHLGMADTEEQVQIEKFPGFMYIP